MFYDKEIDVLTISEGYTDDYGIYHPGVEAVLKTIFCDVQPYSTERLYRDYGYNVKCTKRVFCEIDTALDVGAYVRYKGDKYIINKVIDYDDYLELMINAE